jgi:hypothetical protein
MMKKLIFAMAVVSVGFIVFISGLRAQGIKEGKWTMTMVTKMGEMDQESADAMKEMEKMSPEEQAMMKQMMGGMNVQMGGKSAGVTTTVSQCISDQDPVPDMSSGEDCQETHTIAGNTVHFEEVCSDSKSTGQVTYGEETMSGVIKSQQMVDGKVSDVTIEISGQYVGPCS